MTENWQSVMSLRVRRVNGVELELMLNEGTTFENHNKMIPAEAAFKKLNAMNVKY